jgi:hypothetical protein
MNAYHAHADPPRTLTERLRQLNDSLRSLGERLKASIAAVVGDAVADAVRDALHKLLGGNEASVLNERQDYRDRYDYRDPRDSRLANPWRDDDDRRSEDAAFRTQESRTPAKADGSSQRWRNALSAALQTALWWLKHQPTCRPVLTAVAVALAAGVTGFVAGPVIAAGAGVVASVGGLIFTANASQSAAEIAAG